MKLYREDLYVLNNYYINTIIARDKNGFVITYFDTQIGFPLIKLKVIRQDDKQNPISALDIGIGPQENNKNGIFIPLEEISIISFEIDNTGKYKLEFYYLNLRWTITTEGKIS